MPSDADLIQRCRAGDEEAWAELINRYGALILSIPRRYGLKGAQADDVFGEVCVALVRSLPTLRDPQTLPAWLIKTATRATWEASRKAKRAHPEDLPELTGAAPPEEFVALLEEEQLVRRALVDVSERCRKLLELLYFAVPTPSYDDVAAAMDMPRGSLGPTRRRCLERMRRLLEPLFDVSAGGKRSPSG